METDVVMLNGKGMLGMKQFPHRPLFQVRERVAFDTYYDAAEAGASAEQEYNIVADDNCRPNGIELAFRE